MRQRGIYRDAHQPFVESSNAFEGVGLFDGLQKRTVRQVLCRGSVGDITIANPYHFAYVSLILPGPERFHLFVHPDLSIRQKTLQRYDKYK